LVMQEMLSSVILMFNSKLTTSQERKVTTTGQTIVLNSKSKLSQKLLQQPLTTKETAVLATAADKDKESPLHQTDRELTHNLKTELPADNLARRKTSLFTKLKHLKDQPLT